MTADQCVFIQCTLEQISEAQGAIHRLPSDPRLATFETATSSIRLSLFHPRPLNRDPAAGVSGLPANHKTATRKLASCNR